MTCRTRMGRVAPALPSPDLTVSVSVAEDLRAARKEVVGIELDEGAPFPVWVAALSRDERITAVVGVGVGTVPNRGVRDLRARLVQDNCCLG